MVLATEPQESHLRVRRRLKCHSAQSVFLPAWDLRGQGGVTCGGEDMKRKNLKLCNKI